MKYFLFKKKILKSLFLLFDLSLIYFAFILAFKIRFYDEANFINFLPNFKYNNILFFSFLVWVILCFVLDLIHVPRTRTRIVASFWNYIFYPQFILNSILFLFIIFFNYDEISRLFLFLFIIIQFSFLIISKKIRSFIFAYLRISGYDLIGLGIISNIDNFESINKWLNETKKKGFYFKNLQLGKIYLNSENYYFQLLDILRHDDYLLLDESYLKKRELLKITELAENKGIHIYKILNEDKYDILKNKGLELNHFGSLYTIKSRRLLVKKPISIINKRFFDFLFSLTFLVLIYWWIYLIVSVIIKIQSKGPVLFKQERVGLDGDIFMCYKFRTMNINSSDSKDITKIGDQRIFSFGQFLRKVNIDEFPQFINVFKGDMSVVGPRPHMVSEDKMLAQKVAKYRLRRWVKPGITGYAAMKGYRGGTESIDLMQRRIDLDVEYIEKWSFLLDIRICFDTFLEIIFLKKKGH